MTAPLAPERLAEVRARADDAQQALLTGTVGSPPNTEGLSKDGAIDVLGSSAADVPDLLAEVERLTERAEQAERALARVEEAGIPVGRELLEDAIDHVHYFITERLGNERSVQGAKVLKSQLREAMEGAP